MEAKQENTKALNTALSEIEKQYGKGAIMRMGGTGALLPISIIPTGSLELDFALGVGGAEFGHDEGGQVREIDFLASHFAAADS